ncbi:MAG: TerB family tellurite resistance protein [Deltaproteobacteria bacterium]|nr:TerB family tellurite resistance protein [Deltaproteobacteria bacterium]
MIDMVKKFFGKRGGEKRGEKKESFHDIRIATLALLLEMSQIDGHFSDSERDSIVAILKKDYQVSDEEAESLIESAESELKGSLDLWQFSNLINQNYTPKEKTGIIEMVWRIAYTDGRLDKHEDFLVHKLADLLHLSHSKLIDAKVRVRKAMGIEGGSR